MKKLILLVGIFVSSITFSQNEKEIPIEDKFDAVGIAQVVYDMLTEDMELLREKYNYDKFISKPDNEFNITDNGMQLGCLGADVNIKTASYDDCIELFNSELFLPIKNHKTTWDVYAIYVCDRAGGFVFFNITDLETSDIHSVTVGYFPDATIKSINLSLKVNEIPLETNFPEVGGTVYYPE